LSYVLDGMPARPKTTDAQIVKAALLLVERHGRDGFSMNDVAGVQGPCRLAGRDGDSGVADLAKFLGKAISPNDPRATIMKQAKAIRRFAKKQNSYSLFFSTSALDFTAV
jgi:hypothetical protein